MTIFTVETIAPRQTAVVRADVPIAELPAVFDRAFHEVMRTVAAQGLTVTSGPRPRVCSSPRGCGSRISRICRRTPTRRRGGP